MKQKSHFLRKLLTGIKLKIEADFKILNTFLRRSDSSDTRNSPTVRFSDSLVSLICQKVVPKAQNTYYRRMLKNKRKTKNIKKEKKNR